MRVDGKALTRAEAKGINEILDFLWSNPHTKTATKEELIQGTYGPNAITLLVGGDDWVVHDRLEMDALVYEDGGTTHIGSGVLFAECLPYSMSASPQDAP